jgi:hypothetical protein
MSRIIGGIYGAQGFGARGVGRSRRLARPKLKSRKFRNLSGYWIDFLTSYNKVDKITKKGTYHGF